MNKTVTVNIGGIVFHIDENAYERFKSYLESIRSHFTASEGRDEIMQDIESRIAEMFQEKIKDSKQVITLDDVDEVTVLMGRPEEFGEEKKAESKVDDHANASEPVKKRLFRNPDDKLIGGVCSGLASYFGIDPVWIRLIFAFAFFFYGSGFLLYFVLWFIIPSAETTAEKLQMKGEAINIETIEKNVREELEQVKKRINEMREGKKAGNIISRFFEAIIQLFRLFFLFIGKLLAVCFILIGFAVVFALFISLLAVFNIPGAHFPEFFNQLFPFSYQLGLAFFGVLLAIGIPFIMLAWYGAQILFNARKSSRAVKMGAFGLWISGLLICIFLGSYIARDFSERQSIRTSIILQQPNSKNLYLKLDKKSESEKEYEHWDDNEWNGNLRLSLMNDQLQSKDIQLDIVESNTDSFTLEQISYARGPSKKAAADHASRSNYAFAQSDSVLTFNPYFTIDKNAKYRAQRMQLILHVPKGGKVILDKSLRGFIYDIKNIQNVLDRDMLNRTWEMRNDGFNCVNCDGTESTIGGKGALEYGSRGRIRIDDNGVYIRGDNNDGISIDSNGIVISKNGKIKKIKKKGIHFNINDESN